MSTDKVGLPRAYYENEHLLNPYWNSSGATAHHNKNRNNPQGGLYSTSSSASSSPTNDSDLLLLDRIPTEDANNVVSNETVVIYQTYNGDRGSGSGSGGIGMQDTTIDWERERIRMEFYATYDVMTGLRIAGTLAAFFGLMVMLVMYKSRRRVKDPVIQAVAAEMVQEEEDRELQEAFDTLEAAGIYPELDTLPYRERRLLSLGNISAPPTLSYSQRFSSVGGGSCSLWDPPSRLPQTSVSSRPLPSLPSPSEMSSRREAFRSSRNSSADRSQCVSFDMSEMGRRRSDTRAWMGRRATFQSIQSDSLKSRNKIFLSNTRHGRDSNRIKLIRLYTTSSSREEDVEEVIEHGPLAEEEVLAGPPVGAPCPGRQQSTSTASFIVSSVDYQDSDLRSVGSESMFSERYADTEEEDDERDCTTEDSEDGATTNGREVARLKSGAYQKLQPKRITGRIDDCTIATYEAVTSSSCMPRRSSHQPASTSTRSTTTATTMRPVSLYESRTFELHSLVPKSNSTTGTFARDSLSAIGGQNSRDIVQQLLRREKEQQLRQQIGLPGTSTKWSKETLF